MCATSSLTAVVLLCAIAEVARATIHPIINNDLFMVE
jgi:hypothetical protein